jgi:hypothetical protein
LALCRSGRQHAETEQDGTPSHALPLPASTVHCGDDLGDRHVEERSIERLMENLWTGDVDRVEAERLSELAEHLVAHARRPRS